MEILVCIKQVPSSNRVEIDPVTGVLQRDGAGTKMNPYDLYALEAGLELREQYGGRVSVLTMGPPQAEAVLREAFAMGADAGALLTDPAFAGADVLATSCTLAQGIRKFGTFDLILCGLRTTDGGTAQVGPEVSEMLGIPCVCDVAAIGAAKNDAITVLMEMAEDMEEVCVSFPCLLAVQKDIMQPRLPSYKLEKETAGREITVFSRRELDDGSECCYGLSGSPTQVQRMFPPITERVQQTLVGTNAEMADQLYRILKKKKFMA